MIIEKGDSLISQQAVVKGHNHPLGIILLVIGLAQRYIFVEKQ